MLKIAYSGHCDRMHSPKRVKAAAESVKARKLVLGSSASQPFSACGALRKQMFFEAHLAHNRRSDQRLNPKKLH